MSKMPVIVVVPVTASVVNVAFGDSPIVVSSK
jgi:hypothetical protein